MQPRSFLGRVDWSHVALVLVLAGLVAWYFVDAYGASTRIENLILIAPATLVALVLCLHLLLGAVREAAGGGGRGAGDEEAPPTAAAPAPLLDRLRPLLLMAVFAGYVLAMGVVGFDVATFGFLAVALVLQGERRPLLVLGYSAVFALLVTFAFKWLLPYPMPTALL